ncbi:MAG: FAD-dependent oxidoreductase [Candidatus Microsaccharimonas sossegonensis]|uniref:FAD-dependent oxidoreductase n=1 Tax=Candidatus Microsaccharimonas sossegonensis TaxID=2506948 RepID=A0A4Q0AIN3_9BACT|nr:MAG: FAD-dependent oxidoreductase [Candidatus Microsaccharimonas sossegonensis]
MVTKNINIHVVVRHITPINETHMSVCFERPAGFEYESGDWIDLNFLDGNPKGGTTYSLSSSPTESLLAITFKRGISPFKQRLQSLLPGDEMSISQFGNDYGFHLKEHRSSVLIAGGIGIAPFRSMLKEMVDTDNKNHVQLIYMNKEIVYVFAEEIDLWQKQLSNLVVEYIDTKHLNRKKRQKLLTEVIEKNAHHYFIAGPEGMVEATGHVLIDTMGISPKNIRIDSFGGY